MSCWTWESPIDVLWVKERLCIEIREASRVIKEGSHLYGQGILVQCYIGGGGIGDTTCLSFMYYPSVKYMHITYEVQVRWTGEYDMNLVTKTYERVSLYRNNGAF